eukprot:6422899-Amphidinium_carterae.1
MSVMSFPLAARAELTGIATSKQAGSEHECTAAARADFSSIEFSLCPGMQGTYSTLVCFTCSDSHHLAKLATGA